MGLRDALDEILDKLGAVAQARASLSEADRRRFAEVLREELDRLGRAGAGKSILVGAGQKRPLGSAIKLPPQTVAE